MKFKAMVDHEDIEQHEGHVSRKRPRTMGLRKALQREREQKPPMEELTFEERISMEINKKGSFGLTKSISTLRCYLTSPTRITS